MVPIFLYNGKTIRYVLKCLTFEFFNACLKPQKYPSTIFDVIILGTSW